MNDTVNPYDPHDHEPLPEGEEQAPPLTHTMAIVRWVILGGMTLFALIMILSYFGATPWSGGEAGATQYHCPMHPTYITAQPGDCPICGMSLVPINSNVDADSAAAAEHGDHAANSEDLGKVSIAKPGQYYCPMCPEVASDTASRCPICKMKLLKFEPGTMFTCDMHREVVTDAPGDCPICGMDLVPVSESDEHAEGGPQVDSGENDVPGLVPVTLDPQRLQLIGVRTGLVERRTIGDDKRIVGFVTPDETRVTNITPRVGGWVQQLFVNQTGQQVSRGQELLTIYSQDLYQAQQDYLVSLQTASRPGTDSLLSATRDQILDAARQRLRLLNMPENEIERLKSTGEARAELPLTSPFDGIVLDKSVLAGQYIGPNQSLFTIADLRKVWVLADVYEADLAGVSAGQEAVMTVTAFPGEEFHGKVAFIYPTVSEQTRTLKVRLEFDNSSYRLRPGMYAEVRLQGGEESVLAVSRDAVMDGSDIDYTFVVHDGTHFEPRAVETGRASGNYVEILSGLSEGEKVVTSANFLIDSESRLQAAISGMGGTQNGARGDTTSADPHAGHGK